MKYLLSGVALAAVIAVAAPVWAQAPAATSPRATAPGAAPTIPPANQAMPQTSAGAETKTSAMAPRRHHAIHMRHTRYGSSAAHHGWRHAGPHTYAWHHHGWRGGHGWEGGYGGGWSDRVADRLNAEELNRVA